MFRLGNVIYFFWKGYAKKKPHQRNEIKFIVQISLFLLAVLAYAIFWLVGIA